MAKREDAEFLIFLVRADPDEIVHQLPRDFRKRRSKFRVATEMLATLASVKPAPGLAHSITQGCDG